VRNAPKELILAAHQVSTHMMQARTPSHARLLLTRSRHCASGQDRRADLNVIEQRRPALAGTGTIERRKFNRTLRKPRSSREQQKKSQQHRHGDGNATDGMALNGMILGHRQVRLAIISSPALLEFEVKAAAQDGLRIHFVVRYSGDSAAVGAAARPSIHGVEIEPRQRGARVHS
jgi:hypothetical protein